MISKPKIVPPNIASRRISQQPISPPAPQPRVQPKAQPRVPPKTQPKVQSPAQKNNDLAKITPGSPPPPVSQLRRPPAKPVAVSTPISPPPPTVKPKLIKPSVTPISPPPVKSRPQPRLTKPTAAASSSQITAPGSPPPPQPKGKAKAPSAPIAPSTAAPIAPHLKSMSAAYTTPYEDFDPLNQRHYDTSLFEDLDGKELIIGNDIENKAVNSVRFQILESQDYYNRYDKIMELNDLVYKMPSMAEPTFSSDLSKHLEFLELKTDGNEKIEPGEFYTHQKFVHRYMQHFDRSILIHPTGSGKTCSAGGTAEQFKRSFYAGLKDYTEQYIHGNNTGIKRVYIITPGKAIEEEFKKQILCKCSDKDDYVKDKEHIHSSTTSGERTRRVNAVINRYYTIITSNYFYQMTKSMTKAEIEKEFSDCLFILDEAHTFRLQRDPYKAADQSEHGIKRKRRARKPKKAKKQPWEDEEEELEFGDEKSDEEEEEEDQDQEEEEEEGVDEADLDVDVETPDQDKEKEEEKEDENYMKKKEDIFIELNRVLGLLVNAKIIAMSATVMFDNPLDFNHLINLIALPQNRLDPEYLLKYICNLSEKELNARIRNGETEWNNFMPIEVLERSIRGLISYVPEFDIGITIDEVGVPLSDILPEGFYFAGQTFEYKTKVFIDPMAYREGLTASSSTAAPAAKTRFGKAKVQTVMAEYQGDVYNKGNFLAHFGSKAKHISNIVYPDGNYNPKAFWQYISSGYRQFKTVKSKSGEKTKKEIPGFHTHVNKRREFIKIIQTDDGLRQLSTKFYGLLNLLNDENKTKDKFYTYTIFKSAAGALALRVILANNGFDEYDGKESFFTRNLSDKPNAAVRYCPTPTSEGNLKVNRDKKRRFAIVTGDITSDTIRNNIIEAYNHPANCDGEYIKILIMTPVAQLGLNLYDDTEIDLMETNWNEAGDYQAASRGTRLGGFKSKLAKLRKEYKQKGLNPDDAKVVVRFRRHAAVGIGYNATIPEIVEFLRHEKSIHGTKSKPADLEQLGKYSADLHYYRLAEEKAIKIEVSMEVIRSLAVDCSLMMLRKSGDDKSLKLKHLSTKINCYDPSQPKQHLNKTVGNRYGDPGQLDIYTNAYNLLYSKKNVQTAISFITDMFKIGNIYNIEYLCDVFLNKGLASAAEQIRLRAKIIKHINEEDQQDQDREDEQDKEEYITALIHKLSPYMYSPKFILEAVGQMINNKITVNDRFGFRRYLSESNNMVFLIDSYPLPQIENTPMAAFYVESLSGVLNIGTQVSVEKIIIPTTEYDDILYIDENDDSETMDLVELTREKILTNFSDMNALTNLFETIYPEMAESLSDPDHVSPPGLKSNIDIVSEVFYYSYLIIGDGSEKLSKYTKHIQPVAAGRRANEAKEITYAKFEKKINDSNLPEMVDPQILLGELIRAHENLKDKNKKFVISFEDYHYENQLRNMIGLDYGVGVEEIFAEFEITEHNDENEEGKKYVMIFEDQDREGDLLDSFLSDNNLKYLLINKRIYDKNKRTLQGVKVKQFKTIFDPNVVCYVHRLAPTNEVISNYARSSNFRNGYGKMRIYYKYIGPPQSYKANMKLDKWLDVSTDTQYILLYIFKYYQALRLSRKEPFYAFIDHDPSVPLAKVQIRIVNKLSAQNNTKKVNNKNMGRGRATFNVQELIAYLTYLNSAPPDYNLTDEISYPNKPSSEDIIRRVDVESYPMNTTNSDLLSLIDNLNLEDEDEVYEYALRLFTMWKNSKMNISELLEYLKRRLRDLNLLIYTFN